MGIDPVTAIIGSSVIGGIGSVVGASKASKAAKQAAAAQSDAAQKQVDLSREIYYDQRGLQQPYYQAGLQGMYGNNGLMNLLGFTTPGGGGASQTANQNQPQNAFASGSYGVGQIGEPQTGPNWNQYLQDNPDVQQWATTAASQPYFTKGAGKAADYNGDGTLSPEEMARYHYQQYGQGEGRQTVDYQPQNAFAASTPAQAGQSTGQVGTAQPVNTGAPAASGEGSMTQTLRQTPGYQFMQDEAKRNLENSFASRGKLLSGSAMQALNAQSLGLADQTYQQSVNNAFNLANIGMGSAAQMQGAGSNYAANAGNAFANMGNAAANGAYGQANAWNQGAQGVYGAAMGGLGMYGAYNGWGGTGGGGAPAAAHVGGNNPSPSDIRVKTDIEPAGQRHGHNWYRYRYVWDEPGTLREGVMAQEVMKSRPDAVTEINGVLAVYYDRLFGG